MDDGMKVMWNIVVATIVLAASILIMEKAFAGDGPWPEINYVNFSDTFVDLSPGQDFHTRWQDINPWVISPIYEYGYITARRFCVTSHCRNGNGRSSHDHCNALDGFWCEEDWADLTRCERMEIALEDYYLFRDMVNDEGYIDIKELGFYPKQQTPFVHYGLRFHVDEDGANWARLDGEYVAVEQGIAYVISECQT